MERMPTFSLPLNLFPLAVDVCPHEKCALESILRAGISFPFARPRARTLHGSRSEIV